jgi:hypothetical protein
MHHKQERPQKNLALVVDTGSLRETRTATRATGPTPPERSPRGRYPEWNDGAARLRDFIPLKKRVLSKDWLEQVKKRLEQQASRKK